MKTVHFWLILAALVSSGILSSAEAGHIVQTVENPSGRESLGGQFDKECSRHEHLVQTLEHPEGYVPTGSVCSKENNDGLQATYEVRQITLARRPSSINYRLVFSRADDYIRLDNQKDESSEVWSRSNHGEIRYQRIFHHFHKIVDYTSGDLKAVGHYPQWDDKAGMIRRDVLAKLKKTGAEDRFGEHGEWYKGQIRGIDVEVLWLDAVSLPAEVHYVSSSENYSLIMKSIALNEVIKQSIPSNYEVMDYADLGDNESDPFVMRVLHSTTGGHHH